MKFQNYFLLALILLVGFTACKREDPQLGDPPSAADAMFNYTPSVDNANIIEFNCVNQEVRAMWDFGNGSTATGTNVTSSYPLAGTYTVTVTVFTQGGSASSTQDIVIAQDDPSLLNSPLFAFLTGGDQGPGFKTWVIDSNSAAHFGVGPDPIGNAGNFPEYYAAGPNDKAGVGMYDDRYTFTLNGFGFDMITQGSAYVHNELAGDFPGSFENAVDYTAPYPDQTGETWTITEGSDTTLTLSGDTWLGMYTGFNTYRILAIDDTTLWLQYGHHSDGLFWYLRLIPEGFVPNTGGGNNTTFNLPLDFESGNVTFTTFGNSTYQIIANPDQSGINTSANVLETVHGNETWAGLFVDLTDPLDFSTNPKISIKVWAPATGDLRVKLENSADPTNDFWELDATVTTANAWEEIQVDFPTAGAMSGVYDRLVLFPGWNVANAGTFYLDDIQQVP